LSPVLQQLTTVTDRARGRALPRYYAELPAQPIYEDDEDRRASLGVLGAVIEDFNWVGPVYSLMTNHYHRVIEAPDGNLAQGMR
jgi:hypothetical protein